MAFALDLFSLLGESLLQVPERLLQAIDALVNVVFLLNVIVRPPHLPRRSTAIATDHVHGRRMHGRWLLDLHSTRRTDVALVELKPSIELHGLHETLPTLLRSLGQSVDDDLQAAQASTADHVLEDRGIGSRKLCNQEVNQRYGRNDHEQQNDYADHWLILELGVFIRVEHAETYFDQSRNSSMNSAKGREALVQAADGACKHQNDSCKCTEEEVQL
mmetsp:Transcript_84580/g.235973  ORF Transcript_84580/g.235973 Transcript_84580/m.235973 type:complete len:217 (+) Transcript_84580:367-1017(+)